MFKKLFGRKAVPTNSGELSSEPVVSKHHWVKVFELELSNMEGKPVYGLTHQLSIGSEIGNVVIADPSVSPRHCTFILQQGVVSVIDHGSIAGTIVNGKKIAGGKYIILEETDVVAVGDLEVRIVTRTEAVDMPDLPVEKEEVVEEEIPEEVEEVEEDKTRAVVGLKNPFFNEKKAEKKEEAKAKAKAKAKKTPSDPSYATNALIRVVAVLADLILAYTIYVVFFPFDEFRAFLEFIPGLLGETLDVNWSDLWQAFSQDYGFLVEMTQDLFKFMSDTFHFGPLFLVFILLRLISTLLLGVSVSEFVLGVKADGNGIWKRIGGVLRVLVGVITGPFLIFDLPAVISRRTLKEFLTFTKTYSDSKFVAIVHTLLYLPILVVLALAAPLFQGFDVPESILVNDKIERRMKAANQDEASTKLEVTQSSRFFNLELRYDPNEVDILPDLKFYGVKNKLNFRPRAIFYHKDIQRPVQMELYKTFDFKELLGLGMKGNFFLYEQYPQIYNFVFSGLENNPAFKIQKGEAIENKFADEFIMFTKTAFELSSANALEMMQSSTPLVKGLMDYKTSFMALLEYKDFSEIGFIKIGNVTFLKVSYPKQRPFDLIIPIVRGEGKIYKVSFDKRENLSEISSKFYKYTLYESNWLPDNFPAVGEAMTPFEAIDFFTTQLNKQEISPANAQALYGYYFEQSAKVLGRADSGEYEIWVNSVEGVFNIMQNLLNAKKEEGTIEEGDPRQKLFQNFRDLKDAVDSKNKEYFGLDQIQSV